MNGTKAFLDFKPSGVIRGGGGGRGNNSRLTWGRGLRSRGRNWQGEDVSLATKLHFGGYI